MRKVCPDKNLLKKLPSLSVEFQGRRFYDIRTILGIYDFEFSILKFVCSFHY